MKSFSILSQLASWLWRFYTYKFPDKKKKEPHHHRTPAWPELKGVKNSFVLVTTGLERASEQKKRDRATDAFSPLRNRAIITWTSLFLLFYGWLLGSSCYATQMMITGKKSLITLDYIQELYLVRTILRRRRRASFLGVWSAPTTSSSGYDLIKRRRLLHYDRPSEDGGPASGECVIYFSHLTLLLLKKNNNKRKKILPSRRDRAKSRIVSDTIASQHPMDWNRRQQFLIESSLRGETKKNEKVLFEIADETVL